MCGYDQLKPRSANCLPALTVLNKRYLVGRVLGQGGFGITYLAKDYSLGDRGGLVAIKEFMPSHYCTRRGDTLDITPNSDQKARRVFEEGRQKFIDEARTLSELRNSTIVVHVLQFFQENNTAYLVMEYLDGDDLRKQAAANGGRLDPVLATNVFLTVASGLVEIHRKGILHRDLSPDNIIVTKDEVVKLVDFGAARSYLSTQNEGMSVFLKPGYAPPEQYDKNGQHGPWCDVYALCATYYYLISGVHVPEAINRVRGERTPTLSELGAPVPGRMSDVIAKGMAVDWKDRYRKMMDLLDAASAALNVAPSGQNLQRQSQNRSGSGQQEQKYRYVSGEQQLRQAKSDNQQLRQGQLNNQQLRQGQLNNQQLRQGQLNNQQLRQGQLNNQQLRQGQLNNQQLRQGQLSNRQLRQGQQGAMSGIPFVTALYNGRPVGRVALAPGVSVFVGREPSRCALVLSEDEKVSRIHCELHWDGRQTYLKDLSSNGTYFSDGRRLEKGMNYPIYLGTDVLLASGNYVLSFSN